MRSKDCRHYSRRELIEIIYELEQREARLERKLEKTRGKLKIRTERMARAGSLAEVAAVLSGLFEAADETAQRYLNDIREQAAGRSMMSLPDGEEKVS